MAAVIGISDRALRDWKSRGLLPYIRATPGTILYDVDEVLAALEERKVSARKSPRKK